MLRKKSLGQVSIKKSLAAANLPNSRSLDSVSSHTGHPTERLRLLQDTLSQKEADIAHASQVQQALLGTIEQLSDKIQSLQTETAALEEDQWEASQSSKFVVHQLQMIEKEVEELSTMPFEINGLVAATHATVVNAKVQEVAASPSRLPMAQRRVPQQLPTSGHAAAMANARFKHSSHISSPPLTQSQPPPHVTARSTSVSSSTPATALPSHIRKEFTSDIALAAEIGHSLLMKTRLLQKKLEQTELENLKLVDKLAAKEQQVEELTNQYSRASEVQGKLQATYCLSFNTLAKTEEQP
jgi:uncharacterized protein (DUF3084 family)